MILIWGTFLVSDSCVVSHPQMTIFVSSVSRVFQPAILQSSKPFLVLCIPWWNCPVSPPGTIQGLNGDWDLLRIEIKFQLCFWCFWRYSPTIFWYKDHLFKYGNSHYENRMDPRLFHFHYENTPIWSTLHTQIFMAKPKWNYHLLFLNSVLLTLLDYLTVI